MIIFDLEWNSGYGTKSFEEIIQIGAVKTNGVCGRITDSFNVYIRPSIHQRFNKASKDLPEIQESKLSDVRFPKAVKSFFEWCGGDDVFATWGQSDFPVLIKNLTHYGIKHEFPQYYWDLQAAFGLMMGTTSCIALHNAIEYCRLPDCYHYHNALNDAMYSAVIGMMTEREYINAARCAVGKYGLRPEITTNIEDYEKLNETIFSRLSGRSAALNNRGVRRQLCPVCGSMKMANTWFSEDGKRYLSRFKCAEHGGYLRCVDMSDNADGTVNARCYTVELSDDLRVVLREAQDGQSVSCVSHQHRNNHYCGRRTSSAAARRIAGQSSVKSKNKK